MDMQLAGVCMYVSFILGEGGKERGERGGNVGIVVGVIEGFR